MDHVHDEGCTIDTTEGYVCRETGECIGEMLVKWGFDDNMRSDSTFRYSDVESTNDRRELELSRVAHSIIQRVLHDVLRCDEAIVIQWFAVPQVWLSLFSPLSYIVNDVYGYITL
jgi:hypothetical protein